MFFIHYISAELRRRRGRTLLTALGLAVGVGLVVVVSALSDGLDKAQDEVLEPLTGVGTDMSVARPLRVSSDGDSFRAGPGQLSEAEQRRLRRENGGGRFELPTGNPGEHFEQDDLVSTSQLSFSERQAEKVAALEGVEDVSTSLTLNSIHVEGTVPEQGDVVGGGPGAGGGPPQNIDLKNFSVTGVDTGKPDLAQVTPGQITSGRYLSDGREAVVTRSYARREDISIGEKRERRRPEVPCRGHRGAAARRAALGRVRAARAAPEGLRPRGPRELAERPCRGLRIGGERREGDRDLVLRSAGDDRLRPRRPRGRLARRRAGPRGQARRRARRDRSRRVVPDREPADARLGEQAHARAGHPQSDRLAAAARGPPGRGRVARAGRPWRRARRARRARGRGGRDADRPDARGHGRGRSRQPDRDRGPSDRVRSPAARPTSRSTLPSTCSCC